MAMPRVVAVCVLVACGGSRSAPPAPALSPRPALAVAAIPSDDAALLPLVPGAVYEYDATFSGKSSHVVRVVRTKETPVGRLFYFVESPEVADDNPSIGSNNFGLGAYRVTSKGIETADAYFLDEMTKITALQLAVAFPIEHGATTTLLGGKKLETTVVGPETVTVPAGTFECLRLDQREVWPEQVYEGRVWLSKGVGTVKRVYVTGRTEVLTTFRR